MVQPPCPDTAATVENMTKSLGTVETIYLQLKEMAANYEFKPDSRLNETELAKQLDTSRTPLREALNRLVAEGFLAFKSGQGFFCRSLTTQEIMNLYEARAAIEGEVARLAAQRADDAGINDLFSFLETTTAAYSAGTSPGELVDMDEEFHIRLARLTGNSELVRLLENVNGRLRYIRLIDLKTLSDRNGRDVVTTEPHRQILTAVQSRDAVAAEREMRSHIERRLESITENVRNAFAQLYAQ